MQQNHIATDPWKIIEDNFDAKLHPNSESLMSLGNGRMGQRANFEETYTGEHLMGNYIAGVYYPDKTRVGWWKNGYPEYFAKVLNAVNWTKIELTIDNYTIDLAKLKILSFHRSLDMKRGVLDRSVTLELPSGTLIEIESQRFYSIVDLDTCYLRYQVSSPDKDIDFELNASLDFNVRNSDSNYDEDFWTDRDQGSKGQVSWVCATTKKTHFKVCAASNTSIQSTSKMDYTVEQVDSEGIAARKFTGKLKQGDSLTLTKATAICSSFYYDRDQVVTTAIEHPQIISPEYDKALSLQEKSWLERWNNCDVRIKGDESAQQGIRFNIFQLYQTYSGDDERLNIGPKGFTGEKYGGSTYWDTEAYCLPFYMSTAGPVVAKKLLLYRYNHLGKAIENAEKLGFTNGAALYPMVTMNGEECHNEWEITFEEIHRNGAIAYAIYDYINYTGDLPYLSSHGLEVLIAISRFWSQRVHISPQKQEYVMLGVTGPNEYENNVDNNWYTNYLARWCLQYTIKGIELVSSEFAEDWDRIAKKSNFTSDESDKWADIVERMYLPFDEELSIFLQQDGYLNKENILVSDLKAEDRPLNQNWSWDRILRSPFIKQADVLQGLYFFEDHFSRTTLSSNFTYYEPRTVHESSLSPCVHAILAASLDMPDKAYEMYLRTARLDLDNYNNDTEDGCHITSMAGTWMTIVKGFAGMKMTPEGISFTPFVPKEWQGFSFKVNYRDHLLEVDISHSEISVVNNADKVLAITLAGHSYEVKGNKEIKHKLSI